MLVKYVKLKRTGRTWICSDDLTPEEELYFNTDPEAQELLETMADLMEARAALGVPGTRTVKEGDNRYNELLGDLNNGKN